MAFNKARAQHALDFFPKYLRHTKGRWAGKPFYLLPWQAELISKLFGTLRPDGTRQYNTVYCEIPKKNGKAIACDTPIPTPSGWVRMGDLKPGDTVFAETGAPCRVLAVSPVMTDRPCFRVCFSDASEIVADADHLWETETYRPWMKRGLHTTQEIFETLDYQNGRNHKIRLAQPLRIDTEEEVTVHPYVLGAWLGDGASATASLTCSYTDYQIIKEIERCGIPTYEWKSSNANSGHYHLGPRDRSQAARNDCVQARLRRMDLLHNKHIPREYLWGGFDRRLALLQGLMDTDGTISAAGQCEFTTTKARLAADTVQLIRSLGLKVSCHKKRAMLDGRDCGPSYRLQFWPNGLTVFRLSRKVGRQKPRSKRTRSYYRKIIAVDPVRSVPVRCIQVDNPTGMFLAGEAMVPTHNSELAAGTALYLLFADHEPGAEIYSAASDRDQASIVFNVAVKMVQYSKALSTRCKIVESTKRIIHNKTGGVYRVLSAEAYSKHGYNVHGVLFDELHAQPGRELWDVLTKGSGDARTQPVYFAITTAGYDRHSICWEVHEYARQVRDGIIKDPTFLPVLYYADEEDDWTKQETWEKCNPSMMTLYDDGDGVLDVEKIKAACKRAQNNPAEENSFRRLRLNQWVKQESRFLPMSSWEKCGKQFDPEELRGKMCFGGLDLASSIDIAAFVLAFAIDSLIYLLPTFWVPAENIDKRAKMDKVPYDQWVTQGHLKATPGNVIDYATIRHDINELSRQYEIREVAFDRWGAVEMSQNLTDDGFTMVEFGQGYRSMSPPTKELLKLTLGGRIRHGGNPVLTWMADNVVVTTDPAENIKPDKGKSTERIDGIVASVMALDRLTRGTGSVYAERGLLTI